VCGVLCSAQIADAGRHGAEDHGVGGFQALCDQKIVGIETDGDGTDKIGDQDVVRPEHDDAAELVGDHGPDVLGDVLPYRRGERLHGFLLQIRVEPVGFARKECIADKRCAELQRKVQDVVPGQQQRRTLRGRDRHAGLILVGRDDVLLLVRTDQGLLVDQKIRDRRIQHEHEVNQADVRDVGNVADDILQKRCECRTEHAYGDADDRVKLPVERHQRQNQLPVTLSQRLVHAVGNGSADAELCQREHGENVCKCAIQPQILLGQHDHEDLTGDEIHHDRSQLEQHGCFQVPE